MTETEIKVAVLAMTERMHQVEIAVAVLTKEIAWVKRLVWVVPVFVVINILSTWLRHV